ncbi:phosphoribosyltransferase [Novosphingobium panipatense]|uniref:phosphoribosyltransferase n=1 Tax=Novosphingobium panipatense TaxID=428991 RepID=UPI00360683D7
MQYRSFADLAETVFFHAGAIPDDVDLVVGVPRSGLLPANLLALQLHKPLLDLESYLQGRTPTVGRTARQTIQTARPRRVLIVDDSIASGSRCELSATASERLLPMFPQSISPSTGHGLLTPKSTSSSKPWHHPASSNGT